MATFYAIPTLSNWGNHLGGGWSNTSGGSDNGLDPAQTDPVIFDANSGSARTIGFPDGDMACASLSMTTSNAINLNGAVFVYGNITLAANTSVTILGNQTTSTLAANGATIGTLTVSAALNLATDLSATSGIQLATTNSNFNAANFNVTIGAFTNLGSSQTITMGSGTWTLTGTGTVWSPGSCTIVPGTSTIKLTNNSASSKTIAGSYTYNNIWNATSGGGEVDFTASGNAFNNFKVNPGTTTRFTPGTSTTVATLTADGTGSPITLNSLTSGSAATLIKSGGGTIYVDYCSIKDITASPASTFFARNSTNVSGNTNWTFVQNNSKFMAFF